MSIVSESHQIAIIGMACRVPGADDYRRFGQNLRERADFITTLSRESLLAHGVPAERVDHPRYVPVRGIVSDVDMFDNEFFAFSASDARALDPQYRLFFMTAWHALEDAGYAAPRLRARAGVFGACAPNSYTPVASKEVRGLINETSDHLSMRLSFKLNMCGPSMTVATACSSSLVAVTQAAQALLMGQCDIALAGAVSIEFPIEGYLFQEGSIMSPDGVCRAFDAKAAGTVPGDGVGVVVLKRLGDAIRDADPVRAVICGYGLNNDGNDKVGYSAPSVSGQAAAITMAHINAGIGPDDIGFVEAHGTGTVLGDAVEVTALMDAFGNRPRRHPCALGAVKSSIGHLNTAAGIAGLIKTVLSLEQGVIFPNAHVQAPNPQLGLDESIFHLPTECESWPGDLPRRAGVSSFGVGGTNVHLVVEQAPERAAPHPRDGFWPLPVSAKNPHSLRLQIQDLADALASGADLADVAFTLAEGREAFESRYAVTARDADQAMRILRSAEPGGLSVISEIIFDFPIITNATPELVRELARLHPGFRMAWSQCETAVPALAGDTWSDSDHPAARCALQYALARMWAAHGIQATRITASGSGSVAAAAFTGEIEVDEALHRAAEGAWDAVQAPAKGPITGVWISMADAGRVRIDGREVPRHDAGRRDVVAALVAMWQAGVNLRFSPLFDDGGFRRVPLTGYRFRTQRYWENPYAMSAATVPAARPAGAQGVDISGETITAEVMAAWEHVLGDPPDSAAADFYDVGGDSLAASELVIAIEERFGVRLEPDVIFSDPTPAQLATRIRAMLLDSASPDAQHS